MMNPMVPAYGISQTQYQPQYYQSIPNQYASVNYTQQQPQFVQQQQSPAQMRMSLPGRFINSIDEVKPGEIPMDGSIGLFPQADASCIYVKAWKSDGTINTIKYVPAVEAEAAVVQESQNPLNQEILTRLDAIEKSLNSYKKQSKKEQ